MHMVYKMVGDIIKFMLIFLVFLVGFAHAMTLLQAPGHEHFFSSSLIMFNMNLGDFALESYQADK